MMVWRDRETGPVYPSIRISAFHWGKSWIRERVAPFVDRHGDQHRLADDNAGLAHLLVARIEDQVGKVLIEPPLGKRTQALVEATC